MLQRYYIFVKTTQQECYNRITFFHFVLSRGRVTHSQRACNTLVTCNFYLCGELKKADIMDAKKVKFIYNLVRAIILMVFLTALFLAL